MASLILVIVVSGTVVVFGLVVLIVILVLNRKYKHSRHNVQQNRFQNSPVTFPTQFQMHTISSPVVNQQSSPSANAAPLKRNLPIPAESEEASEEESQEDEENVRFFVGDLHLCLCFSLFGFFLVIFFLAEGVKSRKC
jgi:hypothetical protein